MKKGWSCKMFKGNQNKVLAIIATMAIQLCLGVAYIWSVFQSGVAKTIFEGDNASAALAYSMLLAVLAFGSLAGGMLVRKFSLRMVVMVGGFILFSGFFLASFAAPGDGWMIWLGYGLLGGVGMGFAYSPTISAAQKLFPKKKGLVTGLIVASLGMGGLVFTPIVEFFISANGGVGVGELPTLRILSYIFLAVCTIGSLFLISPKEEASASSVEENKESSLAILKNPSFYLVAGAMMLACVGGLMMIGFAKPIAIGRGMADTATIGVLMISVFNAVGRLTWGVVSDKLGRYNTLVILMLGSGLLALLVNSVSGYLIYVLIGAIGFFYGGLLSTFPTLTAEVFGAKNMAINYGLVLIGFGAGAIIASNVAGYFVNVATTVVDGVSVFDASMIFPAFAIAASCSAVAILMILLVKKRVSSGK